ncbi:glycosyltransferase family 4 protein [Aestuariibaculum sp. M13]|uniref:glycosyltransferase family 4 protein n=1 Tax=Aestuariibaculum sp. M13 TaxID=2967132 RepID=UPI002159C9CA|nr:glycosyltransferase family 4 protein [Aestuariibaculum sp. M13]MCR8666357.1 glycosyltransferase family 4 protein [Aestuariibaculum sp. M13]
MSKRIRILFTISNFNTAGSGKVLYDLVRYLDKEVFDVAIACGDRKGTFFKTIENLGLPVYIFETKTEYRPYLTLLFRILKISRFYKKHQFDLIHSWQWSSDWTEVLAAKLIGVKWVYTKKAMGFKSRHWKYKSYLADFIITINDEMHSYFPKNKNQRLIPLGLDTDYYNPNYFEKRKNPNFQLVTVANLVPVKGIEVLLYAVSLLKDNSVLLKIVGSSDTDYDLYLKTLCGKLNIKNQVSFISKQLDVRPFIASADLFVIPTLNKGRKEGMPMALVEAMSMGVPVLGSNITGINFVLKSFKELLFEAGNPESLKEKIISIMALNEVERSQLGDALRDYCVNHFSIKNFVTNHEILYQELIRKL